MFDDSLMEMLDFHRSMILDRRRVETFARAIATTVEPGDVVLDIGTGTGLLACIAARSGARRVYAVEVGPVASPAEEVIAANGLGDRIEVIRGLSTDIELSELATVVVSETIGNMGFDEGILAWVADARARLTTPDARVVPGRVETVVAALDAPVDYEWIDVWSQRRYGLDLAPLRAVAASTPIWTDLSPVNVITAPAVCLAADMTTAEAEALQGSVDARVRRPGTIHGIGAWFRAELTTGIELTNAPPTPVPSWSHVILPLVEPCRVETGDIVGISLSASADGGVWTWKLALDGKVVGTGATANGSGGPDHRRR